MSTDGQAAINHQAGAGDPSRLRAGQIGDCRRHVLWLAAPAEGMQGLRFVGQRFGIG
jgi:hypothetical protein